MGKSLNWKIMHKFIQILADSGLYSDFMDAYYNDKTGLELLAIAAAAEDAAQGALTTKN